MEIKILCECGAKYKFQVEPENGRSPGPVRCPACGVDSTEMTNRLIADQLAVSSVVAPPAPAHAASPPNAPVSPKMAFMPAPAAGSGSSLSVAGAQPKAAEAPAHASAPPPVPPPMHPASGKMAATAAPTGEGNFAMGVIGAIVGCLIGAVVWYVLAVNVIEGWRILAWIPGIVGGFLAILLARRPSEKLGIAAAVVAGVITIPTQFAVIA